MTKYLDPQNRPEKLQETIDQTFTSLIGSGRKWQLNGSPSYDMALVPEHYLILEEIISAYSNFNQTIFNILDIGAGNFLFVKTLPNLINIKIQEGVLPSCITLNILGTRAEPNTESTYSQIGNCHVHTLGNFACENLISELTSNGFGHLIGRFSTIVIRYTLIHLLDPIGEIQLIHNCLDNGGRAIFDNQFTYYHMLINDKLINYNDQQVTALLLSCFHKAGDEVLSLVKNQNPVTIIKKIGYEPLNLPFNYYDGEGYTKEHKILVMNSEKTNTTINLDHYLKRSIYNFVGDKALFDVVVKAAYLQIQDYLSTCMQDLTPLTATNKGYYHGLSESMISNYINTYYGGKLNSVLPLGEQYGVDTYEHLLQKLTHQLKTIEDCIDGKSKSFKYIDFGGLKSLKTAYFHEEIFYDILDNTVPIITADIQNHDVL